MFNHLNSEKDKKELESIMLAFNLDIYGYSNDQAFIPMGGNMNSALFNTSGNIENNSHIHSS